MRILFQVNALVYCATNSFEMTSLAYELQAKSSLNTTNPPFETTNENLDESSPLETTKLKINIVKVKELLTNQTKKFETLISASENYESMIPKGFFGKYTVGVSKDVIEDVCEDVCEDESKEDESKEDENEDDKNEDESKEDESKEDESEEDNSKEDKSEEDKSEEDKSEEDKSKEDVSKEDKSKEDESKEDEGKEDENGETNLTEEQETDEESNESIYYFENLTKHLQTIDNIFNCLLNSIEFLEDEILDEADFESGFRVMQNWLFELFNQVSLEKITKEIAEYMPDISNKNKVIQFKKYRDMLISGLNEFIALNQEIVKELGE